ncbi:MAG: RDD family protein [Chryseobacterium sp.]|nr:MAG: RDD family protein [Chryseobacterium sp.]
MKKISEIKIAKEVSRIKFDENRNRYRENLIFDVRYNPTDIDVEKKRTNAKIIDVVLGLILSIILVKIIRFNAGFFDYLSFTILIVFILNSILENLYGKSVGKYFLKIKVINDEGNNPSLLKSFRRNFLTLVHVLSGFRFKPAYAIEPLPLKRNYHNDVCKTYIINDSKFDEIKILLQD